MISNSFLLYANSSMIMFLPALQILCGPRGVIGHETFECESNNELVSILCSFDGGPEESCSFPLEVEIDSLGTELVMNATDVFGQSLAVTFQLTERMTTILLTAPTPTVRPSGNYHTVQ